MDNLFFWELESTTELNYQFFYLSHPQYVTHIVWRRLLGPNG